MNSIREQVFVIGPSKSLVAAVTAPPTASECGDMLAIVILNTGIIHRVGHHRMFVNLARELASNGHIVVRFDFSGIGDSDARADELPPIEASMADIRVVLDWLQSTRHAQRIVLVGLCSGADHAVIYSGNDPRVVGLVLLDPSIPATHRYYIHYFSRRLFRLSSWLNFLCGRGRASTMLKKRVFKSRITDQVTQPSLDDKQAKEILGGVYRRAVDNKIQFLAVFAGVLDGRQSYREQILDAFPDVPFGSLLQTEFLKECDHVFTFEGDRKRLNCIICKWMNTTTFRNGRREFAQPNLPHVITLAYCMASCLPGIAA